MAKPGNIIQLVHYLQHIEEDIHYYIFIYVNFNYNTNTENHC